MLAIASELAFAQNADEHNAAVVVGLVILWAALIYIARHECECGRCEHCREDRRHRDEERMTREHDLAHQERKNRACPRCMRGEE